MPTILKESNPIAQKVHTCDYCRKPINIGEKYNRCTLVHDGDLYEFKSHEHCHELAYHIEDYGDGITADDFDNFIDDGLGCHCEGCAYKNNDDECDKHRTKDFCFPYILNYYKITYHERNN